jgi:multidrug transporter EmrE-like cation transporter
MELQLWVGLAFAVATAFATNLAFLWKHRGAVSAPAVDIRRPVKSATELFRSKWWSIGWAVAVVGFAFHVGSLALLPLSLAQAVISGGFVVLAVLAERAFGFELQRRQWLGITLVAVGLGLLGATTDTSVAQTRYSVIAIAVFQAGLLVVGLLLVLATRTAAVRRRGSIDHVPPEQAPRGEQHPRTGGPPQAPVTAHVTRRRPSRLAGVLLGTAAGLAFGLSDISIKALADAVIGDLTAIVSPWTATALGAAVGAFYASARSLQIGEGMSVITATTAAANLSTIAGGIIVFGEPLGDDSLTIIVRISAFVLVVAGAGLMPGPVRAAEAAAEEEREEQSPTPEHGPSRHAAAT